MLRLCARLLFKNLHAVAISYLLASSVYAGEVIGHLDGVVNESAATSRVSGWVCETGVEKSINLHIYLKGSNGKIFFKSAVANQKSELAISASCLTSGAQHRFSFQIFNNEKELFSGDAILVYGISTSGGINSQISASGNFNVPAPVFVARKLIKDSKFENGFNIVKSLSPRDAKITSVAKIPNYLQPQVDSNLAPLWNISQWYSKQSIPSRGHQSDSQTYQWVNKYKRIGVNLSTREMIFAINSIAEYDNVFREKSDPWVHLLAQQRISDTRNEQQQSASIANMKKLILDLEARLSWAVNVTDPELGYKANTHAQQFVLYLTIQNLNRNSPGYGKYIWFGVPLYDSRSLLPQGKSFIDRGTNSLIYSFDYAEHSSVSMQTKLPVKISFDILPKVKEALAYAFENNILSSKNLNDYRIGSITTGFETTGLHITTVRIKDLQLTQHTLQP